MVRGVQLRNLHPHHSMWVVAVQGDLLATSTSSVAGEEHSIFIHSTTDLSRLIPRKVENQLTQSNQGGNCRKGGVGT